MVKKDEWFNTLKDEGNSPKSNEKVEKVLPAFALGAARAGMAAAKTPAGQAAIGAAGNFAKDKLQEING